MLVEIENLSKSYPGGAAVLDGLCLGLEKGSSLAVMGESGSGKSTLLRVVGAMDFDWSGEVKVCSRNLCGLDADAAADFRSRKVGFVFQRHFFLPQMSVLENVMLPSLPLGADLSGRAEELLERVGVLRLKDRFPSEVSGGELQRAAVARALLNSPELLIADEPTGALDRGNSMRLIELLRELNGDGLTIILATHSMELARSMSETKFLNDGRLSD